MTETKHTPGPWKSTPSIPEEGYEVFWIESDDELQNQIADVRGPQNAENTSNARLIAAAPELLMFAQEWLDRQGTDKNYMTAKARAAIAKATGEQP